MYFILVLIINGLKKKEKKKEKKKNVLSQIISLLKCALGLKQKHPSPWTMFILQCSDYRFLGSRTYVL